MDASSQGFRLYQLTYPSLAQHFVNSLAIAVQTLELQPKCEPWLIQVEPTPKIGGYRSAIALTLPPQDKATLAAEIGAIAQTHLNAIPSQSNEYPDFLLTPQRTGWIELQCSLNSQLAVIQHIANQPCRLFPPPEPLADTLSQDLIFELQYAHARCASQLRLAESVYKPENLVLPKAIAPWLQDYFKLSPVETSIEYQLWLSLLNFPIELQEQHKLIANLDYLRGNYPSLSANTLIQYPLPRTWIQKLGQSWVRLFQKFYSSCRLLEISQPEYQNLRILRFTLFSGLKTVLKFILTELSLNLAPQFL